MEKHVSRPRLAERHKNHQVRLYRASFRWPRSLLTYLRIRICTATSWRVPLVQPRLLCKAMECGALSNSLSSNRNISGNSLLNNSSSHKLRKQSLNREPRLLKDIRQPNQLASLRLSKALSNLTSTLSHKDINAHQGN